MRTSWWDRKLMGFDACFTNDNGGGDNGGDEGGGGGGNSSQDNKPEWATEFGDKFDPDKAWNLIKNLRESERGLKRTNSDLSGKVKKFEDEGKTELEKLTAKNGELQNQVNELLEARRTGELQAVFTAEARAAGAHYPEDVYRIIDPSAIELTDDGKVKNAAKLVANLKTSRPALFGKAPGADGGSGHNNGNAGGDMNAQIRAAFGR